MEWKESESTEGRKTVYMSKLTCIDYYLCVVILQKQVLLYICDCVHIVREIRATSTLGLFNTLNALR